MVTVMLFLLLVHTTSLSRVTAQINLTPFGTATQSSLLFLNYAGPQNAINPPISNAFSFDNCTHTKPGAMPAWWMFQFSFGAAYITDVTIYYRDKLEMRMDGFKLYVANTSTIPPDGYLCYEDLDPGFPNITQTIPCNQLGQYIIYYDAMGSDEGQVLRGPIVELCYVAINDNMASDGLLSQTPSGSKPANLANDGNKTSCSKTEGFPLMFQVDLKNESIVRGLYITFGESTKKEGYHTIYASNTSADWQIGIILYKGYTLPREVNFNAVFRYLTYVPPVKGTFSELEICEIGIIGCPPSLFGHVCNQSCPRNCNGPCNLETGNCTFGCLNGWTGDKCEQECPNGKFGRNCLQACEGCISSMCDPVNGLCNNTTVCIPGYLYGEYCNTECSYGHFGRNCSQVCEGCLSRKCDPVNGLCDNTTSCSPGYVYGKYCNQPCSQGFYGSNCLKICSQFCLYQTCDHKTGNCIGGCVRGIQGIRCTQVSLNTDSPVSTYVGLSIGCFLLGVLVTVVVCFLILKNRKILKEQGKEKATEKTQSPEPQHYDNVGMENISTYQDLKMGSISNEYDQISTPYVNQ